MPRLDWIGKDKVENYHDKVVFHTLEKQYNFNIEKESENKIIHADNLIALKSLLPQYEGKIKCIYIDPPYNTGNEGWVYNDNVNDPRIKKWLGEVVGKQGEDLSRDDKWLCMMYPRLKLLQKLLSNDGVIFISIDDNEQANLKLLCDEIFGVNNFIMTITWRRSDNQPNIGKIAKVAEYIFIYAKDIRQCLLGKLPLTEKARKEYRYSDAKGLFRRSILLHKTRGRKFYPKETKLGNILNGPWMVTEEEFDRMNANNEIYWTENGDGQPYGKIYLSDSKGQIPNNFWGIEFGTNQQASIELEKIFDKRVFDFPKPSQLLSNILSIGTNKDDIILDSFAGSGTTAHAVLKLNKEDGGNRKFILIEMMDYAENITAERVKRVIEGYKDVEGLKGDFSYYELGKPMFKDEENLNEEVGEEKIRQYIYYSETKQPLTREQDKEKKYLLDNYNYTGYYFYYEKDSLTTLSLESFAKIIKDKQESYIIYADICTLSEEVKKKYHILFKKIPRDIRRF